MKSRKYWGFALFFVLILIGGCSQSYKNPELLIEKHIVKSHDTLESISGMVYFGNEILITSNQSLFRIDKPENQLVKLESNLENIKTIDFYNDSLFIINNQRQAFFVESLNKNKIVIDKAHPKWKSNLSNNEKEKRVVLDEYILDACCKGEWGGSVIFSHKKTNQAFTTRAVCLMNIDTYDGDYYLFNSSIHGVGSFSIVKIGSVEDLPEWQRDFSCNWYYDYPQNDYSNKSEIEKIVLGNLTENQVLLDTIGLNLLFGLVDQGEVKIIYHDQQNSLWLGTVKNNQIIDGIKLDFPDSRNNLYTMKKYQDRILVGNITLSYVLKDRIIPRRVFVLEYDLASKKMSYYKIEN